MFTFNSELSITWRVFDHLVCSLWYWQHHLNHHLPQPDGIFYYCFEKLNFKLRQRCSINLAVLLVLIPLFTWTLRFGCCGNTMNGHSPDKKSQAAPHSVIYIQKYSFGVEKLHIFSIYFIENGTQHIVRIIKACLLRVATRPIASIFQCPNWHVQRMPVTLNYSWHPSNPSISQHYFSN